MTIRNIHKGGGKLHKENKYSTVTDEILCAEYEAVYHYVLSLCRNEDMAQDITQETFLKAMKASDKFKGESSLYTWLCAIAKRQWYNKIKKQNREISSDSLENLNENEKSPEELVSAKDTAMQIHKILHGLSEPYKEVFSLRVFGQLSFSEIAKLFSKTESWARVTYHRARKMINEEMGKD